MIIDLVNEKLAPEVQTVIQFYAVSAPIFSQAFQIWNVEGRFISTDMAGLDKILHGGIPSSSITEVSAFIV
jgi:RecA/RadA recombinase